MNEELAEAIARDDRRDELKRKQVCAYCGHDRKKHCTAGTNHIPYKEEMKQAGGHLITHPRPCVGDHCEVGMCDCLQFRKAAA
jgi:hypothetical protein